MWIKIWETWRAQNVYIKPHVSFYVSGTRLPLLTARDRLLQTGYLG